MSVLRNLSRNLWNAIEIKNAGKAPEAGAKTLHAVREQRVAPVLANGRFRDGFDKLPPGAPRLQLVPSQFRPTFSPAQLQRDSFDSGARRAPVELSGAMKKTTQPKQDAKLPNLGATLSDVSLGDLAALMAA
ncbi:MAG: hypothetical protein JNM17_09920 [Archangium sp.]|nr:hypothetical protein [Archangium sp.]